MTKTLRHWVRIVAVPLLWAAVIAAPFVEHAAIATGRLMGVAVVFAVIQAGMLGTMALRQTGVLERCVGVIATAALLLLLLVRVVHADSAGTAGLMASSGISHAIIYSSLLLLFGQSLRPGRTALVTGVATRIRGTLKPRMLAYTRTVTKAWCLFFAAQLVLSAILLVAAPHEIWSLFVNVLDGPLAVVMFAAEYTIRRWRFRNDHHESPLATIRSFARGRAGG
ncbi:hypothetical protein [Acidisphaera sp. L21]|jgi:uncharacterized membrane protein|uniref:hypothetical protein n=1 Tax=Acidisphaera sp. L21 TaxID=1641851 RepID=UPI00131D3AB1|nr:hypothetical protein [Acidisphaera sp. L21]